MGDVVRQLRRGVDARQALAEGVGEELAARVVEIGQRALVRSVGGAERNLKGAPIRRTARCEFGADARRDANAPVVRKLAELVATLAGWMRPASKRTGGHSQGGRLATTALARRLGVTRREVARWLVVLRKGGVIESWQPPAATGMPRGKRSGHCFNLYCFAVAFPSVLAQRLERFYKRAEARPIPAGPAVLIEERQPSSSSAGLFARFVPPPDDPPPQR